MDADFQKAVQRNPHLGEYVEKVKKEKGSEPQFVVSLSKDLDSDNVNIILPVGDPIFIHIYGTPEMGEIKYYTVEPRLSEKEKKKYDAIMSLVLEKSAKEPVPQSQTELKEMISKL